jgi:hypothetical protein
VSFFFFGEKKKKKEFFFLHNIFSKESKNYLGVLPGASDKKIILPHGPRG